MKTRNGRTLTAVAILAAMLVAFGGCENFMSKDKTFKESIEKEVKVANAKEFKVRVQAISGHGTTSPNGKATQKVDVPFTVLVSLSEGYGFSRWAAYSSTSAEFTTDTELDSSVISFSNPGSLETDVTVHVARNDIVIQPITDKRPRVVSTTPSAGETGVYLNVPIKIIFSKPMNKDSFTFDDGTMRRDGLFKGITINGYTGESLPSPYESYFQDPVLDSTGKILTFKAASGPAIIPRYSFLSIEVSNTLVDAQGYQLAETYSFNYKTGANNDLNPPSITDFYVGNAIGDGYADDINFRRTKNRTVHLSVKATDKIDYAKKTATTGSGLASFTVSETLVYTANGTPPVASDLSPVVIGTGDDEDNATVDIAYTLKSAQDGLIRLSIVAKDTTGNVTPTATSYYFIYDSTPPSTSANVGNVAITGQVTPNGYFNATFTKAIASGTAAIRDSGYYGAALPEGGATRLGSNTIEFSIGFKSGESYTWSPWGSYTIGGSATSASVIIPFSIPDGDAVPVYYRLRDDLGNESLPAPMNPVKKDTVKPTGSVAVNGTVAYPGSYPLFKSKTGTINMTANADLSGVVKCFYRPTDPGNETAPNEDDWNTATNVLTGRSVTFDDADEVKTVNVWFRDAASNVSNRISTSVVKDTKLPTIEHFFVRDVEGTTNPFGEGTTSAAKAFANEVDVWFFAKASDTGTGIGSISYTVNGTDYSTPINFTSNTMQWTGGGGTDPLVLTNVMKTAANNEGVVYIYGKLRLPATEGQYSAIKLKVTDFAGGACETPHPANEIVYDVTPPAAPNVTLNHTGKTFGTYIKEAGNNKLIFDVDEGGTASVKSGLYRVHVAGKTANDLATPFDVTLSATSGIEGVTGITSILPFAFAGGDGLKTLVFTTYDYADNFVSTEWGAYTVDTTPPTIKVYVGATTSPWSDPNAYGNPTAGTVVLRGPDTNSKGWASMYANMTAHNDNGGSGVAMGYSQEMRLYRVRASDITAAVTASTLTATGNGYSGTAVGGVLLTNYSALDNTYTLPTGTNPVMVSYNFNKNITLPLSTPTHNGKALSGYYVVGFRPFDNLGNHPLDEQKLGYFYDETKPVIDAAGFKIVRDTSATAEDISRLSTDGTVYYVPIQKFGADTNAAFYVRLSATDRPSDDPEGAGLNGMPLSVALQKLPHNSATTISSTVTYPGTYVGDIDSLGYVTIDDGSVNHLPLYFNKPTDLNSQFVVTPTFTDKVGNSIADSTYKIQLDDNAPIASLAYEKSTTAGTNTNVRYIKGSSTATFTAIDNPTVGTGMNRPASGVDGYALTDSSTFDGTYAKPASYTGVDIKTALENLLGTDQEPKQAYLHVIDYAGNKSSVALGPSSGVQIDSKPPVVLPAGTGDYSTWNFPIPFDYAVSPSANPNPADHAGYYAGGGKWFLNQSSFMLRVRASDRSAAPLGSGIAKMQTDWWNGSIDGYTDFYDKEAITDSGNGWYTIWPTYDIGPPITGTSEWGSFGNTYVIAKVNVRIEDAVGNYAYTAGTKTEIIDGKPTEVPITTGAATTNCQIIYDGVEPSFNDVAVSSTQIVGTTKYCGTGSTLTFKVNDGATVTGEASGIKRWALGYGSSSTSLTYQTAWQNITGYTGNSTQSLSASTLFQGLLVSSEQRKVFLIAEDNVGNTKGYEVGTFGFDQIKPTVVSIGSPIVGIFGADSAYYVTQANAKVSFTARDDESGISRYYISWNPSVSDSDVRDIATASFTGAPESPQRSIDVTMPNVIVYDKLDASTARPLYLYVVDAVGNVTKHGDSMTGVNSVRLDSALPTFGDPYVSGTPDSLPATGIFDLVVPSAADTGSGVRTITLTSKTGSALFSASQTGFTGDGTLASHSTTALTFTVPYTTTSHTFTFGHLTAAANGTIVVSISDAAGNPSSSTKEVPIVIDTSVPVTSDSNISIKGAGIAGWTNGSACTADIVFTETISGLKYVTLSGFSTLNSPVVKYKKNGESAFTVLATPADFTCNKIDSDWVIELKHKESYTGGTLQILNLVFTETLKTCSVTLEDFAKNEGTTITKTMSWDASPPTAFTLNPPALTTVSPQEEAGTSSKTYYSKTTDNAVFTVAATDTNLDSFGYTGNFVPASNTTISIPVDGTEHTVKAIDKAGNEVSKTIKVVQDNTYPQLTGITVTPIDGTFYKNGTICVAQNAKVAFSITESAGIEAYFIEASTSATARTSTTGITWNYKYRGSASDNVTGSTAGDVELPIKTTEDDYVFLYVIDRVGNFGSWPLTGLTGTATWRQDTDAPFISTDATSASIPNPTLSGTVKDGTAPVVYVSSGASFKFYPRDTGAAGVKQYVVTGSSTEPDWTSTTLPPTSWTTGLVTKTFASYLTTDGASGEVWLHVMDNVGKTAAFQVIHNAVAYDTWYLDLNPPTCVGRFSESEANFHLSVFTDATTTTGTATLFYKDATPSSVTLTYSKTPDDVSGNTSNATFTLSGSDITSATSPTVSLTDGAGNTRTVTITCTHDVNAPAFDGTTTADLPYTYSSTDPKKDQVTLNASDTDESGVNASTLKCYYSKVLLDYSAGINTTKTASTTQWNTYYSKSSKDAYILYDGNLIKGHWDSTDNSHVDLPTFDADNIDYFLVVATDNVGRKTSQIIKRTSTSSPAKFRKEGTPEILSRRGFVPPFGGNVATKNEYEKDSPLKNAWSATGDGLIDWQSGFATTNPIRKNVAANAPTAKITSTKRPNGVTGANSMNVDVESFHRLAVTETSAQNSVVPATTATSAVSFGAGSGNGESTVGTGLLPDSVVEARVSVIAPLAEKFLALRGARFARDPITDARNRLIALVRAGAGDVRAQVGRSQDKPAPVDIGDIGLDRPMAGLLPGENRKKA